MLNKSYIYSDKQIKKFSLYGFLKNLKFFEPYIVIFLLNQGLNLLEIGLLYTIKEIIINIFEIPSGIIADRFGNKNELLLSFVFYIISFFCFFFTNNFTIAIIATSFFGLGEAFRSGTHKAMIYTYLEIKGWQNQNTLVYGKTRSSSLLGSALSSILFIVIILLAPKNNYIFLASILPYILDFILITTYPNTLNNIVKQPNRSIKYTIKDMLSHIFNTKELRNSMLNNGLFESVLESTKDLIQPLLETAIITSGIMMTYHISTDNTTKVILGLTYSMIYIFSSYASKNAYRIKNHYNNKPISVLLNYFNLLFGLVLILIAFMTKLPIALVILFLVIYIINNTRKPIYIDLLGNLMDKNERVSILSVSSQLKSLLTMAFAPLTGFIADKIGINYAFVIVGCCLIFIWCINKITTKNNESITSGN